MRYWTALIFIIALSVAASASSDIAGRFGKSTGFTGRFPITGGIGSGSAPPVGCGTGVINLSTGCTQPMFGGL